MKFYDAVLTLVDDETEAVGSMRFWWLIDGDQHTMVCRPEWCGGEDVRLPFGPAGAWLVTQAFAEATVLGGRLRLLPALKQNGGM